ncbi:kinetochore-associated protein DSN1 homolog isoform X2 [Silurus meridionalis]|uniref:kinetochore-associated protein DSN1 homolog isoform X2 n=1 Tax=Silurus meridionalis TaxID=175797 RepID=UPI001EE9E3B2|nr:kinetochore-associated protein DSN1 homolog isoform X2 [Silurus meridionalis]
MAELKNERFEMCQNGGGLDTVTAEDVSHGTKRQLDRTQSSEPLPKSPRTSSPPELIAVSDEKQPEDHDSAHADQENTPRETMENTEACSTHDLSPRSRRKSWRRSTRGRPSLPALPNNTQSLCKSISLDLSDAERLEKLMEAAMQVAVKRLQNTLCTIPGADLEAFQAQVDSLQTEWVNMAKNIREEAQLNFSSSTSSDPAIQKAIERAKEDLNRLQAECVSWESLLNKHRSKAEELAKRVEEGQERGVKLDLSCLAQSSQSKLILSKPDYNAALQRQHRVLNTMELVLESQCMMMKALLSFQQDSELLMKETSTRLAQSAGFQDLPSSPAKTLLNLHQSATSS